MKTFDFSRPPLLISVAALLTGCGGPQPPIGEPGAMPQGHVAATYTARNGSWMLPKAKHEPLIYISTAESPLVYVYSYGGHLVGQLDVGMPQGECADKAGNVWITDTSASKLLEYAHGGSQPVATLADPGQQPAACSVDLKSGDLAVANICNASSCGNGNVAIYRNATGTPKTYFDPSIDHYYACAYDAAGNLLVDGRSDTEKPGDHEIFYAELHAGAKRLRDVPIAKNLKTLSNFQWASTYYAVEGLSKRETVIYHIAVTGTRAKVEGLTRLAGAYFPDFAITGGKVLTLDDQGSGYVFFWQYSSEKYIRNFMLDPGEDLPDFLVVSP